MPLFGILNLYIVFIVKVYFVYCPKVNLKVKQKVQDYQVFHLQKFLNINFFLIINQVISKELDRMILEFIQVIISIYFVLIQLHLYL